MAAPQTLDPNPCQTAQTPGQCPANTEQFFIIQPWLLQYCINKVFLFWGAAVLCTLHTMFNCSHAGLHTMHCLYCAFEISSCMWTPPTPLLLSLQVNTTNITSTATVPSSRLPQSLISPIYQMPAQNLDQQLVCPLHGRFVLWNMTSKKYMKGDHTLSETRHLKSWLVGIWQSALPGSWFHIWEWEGLWQWFQTVRDCERLQKVLHPILYLLFSVWRVWVTTKGSPSHQLVFASFSIYPCFFGISWIFLCKIVGCCLGLVIIRGGWSEDAGVWEDAVDKQGDKIHLFIIDQNWFEPWWS